MHDVWMLRSDLIKMCMIRAHQYLMFGFSWVSTMLLLQMSKEDISF